MSLFMDNLSNSFFFFLVFHSFLNKIRPVCYFAFSTYDSSLLNLLVINPLQKIASQLNMLNTVSGFVILILICCCCRIRRPPADSSAAHASQANYQRAPLADGMGGGMAYPLTSLPPETGFPNASIGYQAPPQMASVVKMDYGMIGSGKNTFNSLFTC